MAKFSKNIIFRVKLKERKDHFVILIKKEYRKCFDLAIGDLLILNLSNIELIRPIRKDFMVSLPKNLLLNSSHGDEIFLNVDKIVTRKQGLSRSNRPFLDKRLDIRYFIPLQTRHNYPLYVISRGNYKSSVWFPVGGGVNHVTINNSIDIEKISEFLGFYFGDGTKCYGITSLRMTNCEPSILIHCLDILGGIGLARELFKVQVIYSTNKQNLSKEIKKRCKNYWSGILNIPRKNIVSVNKANNVRETQYYGSARVFMDSSVLVEIILYGLLKGILEKIKNPQNDFDRLLLEGFLRGLLAAEGFPELNVFNSLIKIGIAFNPHSNELDLYKKLLTNLNINFGKAHGNALYTYGHDNFKKFLAFDAFKLHKKRDTKFKYGFFNHSKTKL